MNRWIHRIRLIAQVLAGRADPDWAAVPALQKPPRLATDHGAVLVFGVSLLLAASADFVAFKQVVELEVTGFSNADSMILVTGLTAIALTLAHRTGAAMRDRVDGVGAGRGLIATCAGLCWTAYGGTAYYIRLQPGGSLAASGPLDTHRSASTYTSSLPTAVLFLVLYAGTGIIAMATTFIEHDAARSDYRRARRHLIKVQARSLFNAAQFVLADLEHRRLVEDQQRDTRFFDPRRQAIDAHAGELGQLVRQLIAARQQDPAATDGLFPPRADLCPPPGGSPPGGH